MNKNPISRDFKVLLLSILKQGYMTFKDRTRIEEYLQYYFDGVQPPELEPLSSKDIAELILHYENDPNAATFEGVAAEYKKKKSSQGGVFR